MITNISASMHEKRNSYGGKSGIEKIGKLLRNKDS